MSRTENERKKWANKCIVEKVIVRGAESDIIIKCGNYKPFICFDSTDSRPKEGTQILVQLGSLGGGEVKISKSNRPSIMFEETTECIGAVRIKKAIGKVIHIIEGGEVGGNTIIADIGGIYVEGIDRAQKKAKIGDFVEFNGVNYIWGLWKI